MRGIPNLAAEKFRVTKGIFASDLNMGNNGQFLVTVPKSVHAAARVLKVQISDGAGWDHVSVSLPDRCPAWEEMCFVKELFFLPDEVAIQSTTRHGATMSTCTSSACTSGARRLRRRSTVSAPCGKRRARSGFRVSRREESRFRLPSSWECKA